jgi:hypothetical protein
MNFAIPFFLSFFMIGFGFAYGYGEVLTSDFRIVNSLDQDINSPVVDQQLSLQTSLKNLSDKNISWAYIVQITDSNGAIIDLNFATGSFEKNQTLTAALSWTPHSAGNYKIETFVWDNLRDIDALAPKSAFTITVT